ncbi:MAG: glycosyltransferase [Planctomycetota bacterium]|jgi:GT2 family glycosyltransferase|nr:glycosyltransferase [Planctomycetota bacterium]
MPPIRPDAISVIIPTFNRVHTLGRALDSIYVQSTPPAEIIVVDDGSTDETHSFLQKEHSSVRQITQENRGVSAARNRGIAASHTTWIALLDSDDAWKPDKLTMQIQALEREPSSRICHTEEIWIRKGRRVNPKHKHAKSEGWLFERSLELCCISPSSVLFHRSLFDDHGPFDESLPACEDYDLWLRVTATEPVTFVSQPVTVKYGGHEDQLSRTFWGMDRFRIRSLEKLLQSKILSHDQSQAAVRVLVAKLEILVDGALKRDNRKVLAEFEPALAFWSGRHQGGF